MILNFKERRSIMDIMMLILAILAGALFPIQGSVNGLLRGEVGNPFVSGAISNTIGMLIMLILAYLTRQQIPISAPETTSQNWYMWLGGLISALVVSANIIIPPYIGFSTFLSIYMVSQLVISVLIDHYALFGAVHHPASFNTVIGIVFLGMGIYFIVYRNA